MIEPRVIPVCPILVAIMALTMTARLCASPQESPAALSGFSESEVFDIQDHAKFSPDGVVLQRLLYRVGRISEKNYDSYGAHTREVTIGRVLESPRDFRCYVFELGAHAKKAWKAVVDQDSQPFYIVLAADPDGIPILIAVPQSADRETGPTVPKAWLETDQLDENIRFHGFFMAVDDVDGVPGLTEAVGNAFPTWDQSGVPVLVAPMVDWFPDQVRPGLSISSLDVLLAGNGVDMRCFKEPSRERRGAIQVSEMETFYQLLSAVNQLDGNRLDATGPKVTLGDLLKHPDTNRGKPVFLKGDVRQVTPIEITDPYAVQKYGLDSYYQLDVLVPLDGERIRIESGKKDDSDSLLIENRFPVTVCVPSLPEGGSAIMKKRVRIDGIFFRLWGYESELTRTSDTGIQQVGPLVIGWTPEVVELPSDSVSLATGIGAGLFFLGVVVLGLFVWKGNRKSESRRQNELPGSIKVPPNES